MKILKVVTVLILLFILFGLNTVNADMGSKPSITIHLKNMNTTAYTLDLLTKPSYNEEEFYKKILYVQYKNEPIYKYNEDGWMATALRDNLLWGNIEGNSSKTHSFTYFGVPNEFKVIIQYKNGTVKTSDVIQRTEFDYEMYLDVNTMKVEQKYSSYFGNIFTCMAITVIIEVLIAIVMNIKYTKQIILVNVITQIVIQSLNFLNFSSFAVSFVIAELIVFFIEYGIYKKLFKDIENNKIIKYTLVANITTALLTFCNNIVIFLILAILFIVYINFKNKNKIYRKDYDRILGYDAVGRLEAQMSCVDNQKT